MANGYRTLSQHLNDLKKENFSLKLRIYFLEERVQQKGEESRDDVYRRVSARGGRSAGGSLPVLLLCREGVGPGDCSFPGSGNAGGTLGIVLGEGAAVWEFAPCL